MPANIPGVAAQTTPLAHATQPDAPVARVLTIAGSDSGGGAGIEADLKTFTALRVYGMAAITSVTAQNTLGVTGAHDLPPEFVAEQIRVVVEDIGVDAAKTGMLSNAAIIEAVAATIEALSIPNLVVDPVMLAKSGTPLLQSSACDALRTRLFPLARIVTPNIPEAEALAKMPIANDQDILKAAIRIQTYGPHYVLIKGGHREGPEAIDFLFDGNVIQTFAAPRHDTQNTHGTGCTFSAAIAAYLAQGLDVLDAVARAKAYLSEAIRNGFALGKGHGPLNHFWPGTGTSQ